MAAELGPNDPNTYFKIGAVCTSLNEDWKAIEAYKIAIRLKSPSEAICYINIGNIYENMGKYEQAMACFETAKKFVRDTAWCDKKIAECKKQLE